MKTIGKNEIGRFLDGLLTEHTVYAPVRRSGIVVFDSIRSGCEATLDYANSTASPKHVVIPRMETLLSSDTGGADQAMSEHTDCRKPLVLFGARPCDARAFMFLDKVFCDGKNRDVYYCNRRDALLIIAIGCTQPQETCFCTTTGGGPLSADGSDILLEARGDGYLVHVTTSRGEALATAHGLHDPSEGDPEEISVGDVCCRPAIQPPVDLGVLKKALDGSFDDPFWLPLAEKCLGCGVCSYLCPACHCFDIVDEEAAGVRVRNRVWDSCQFPCFTSQASGFNPRPTGRERYRQRIMHKFSYCIDNYGIAGCVGCGRCVSECPVNLDMRQVLAAFQGRRGDR
jgi:sulfhydrogenase subunit beta (sulfur reductase)